MFVAQIAEIGGNSSLTVNAEVKNKLIEKESKGLFDKASFCQMRGKICS